MKSAMRYGAAALLWWGLSLSPLPVWALQTITGPDTAVVKVSNSDLNRIVLPSRILKAYTSKSIDVKVEGSEAYVKMPPMITSPVELYLVTEAGTYTLLLVAAPVPAETVVIRAGAEAPPALDTSDYIQQIKYLIRAVANGTTPPGYDVMLLPDGKENCPVKECSLALVRRLTGRNLVITEYRLTNPTKESRTYYEDLFSRPGVRAIAIEQHELKPGDITRLFRIEEVTP